MALTPKGMATRLRVFAAVKRHMEETGECPSAHEVGRTIGADPALVAQHMRALRDASGLPFKIPTGASRRGDSVYAGAGAESKFFAGLLSRVARGDFDPNAPIPVDALIARE